MRLSLEVKQTFEAQVDQKVHATTVYRMLYRHGWHKFTLPDSHS